MRLPVALSEADRSGSSCASSVAMLQNGPPSRAFVYAAEILGWLAIAATVWGGFRIPLGSVKVNALEPFVFVGPYILLLAAGLWCGAIRALEDVPLLRRLHGLAAFANRHRAAALAAMIALYVVWMTVYTFRRYSTYSVGAFDLGVYDQVLWNTLHGGFLFSSLRGDIVALGDHFSPILAVLSPIYLFWDDPRCLILFQTLAVASGAIPLFFLARDRFGASPLAVVFAGLYLLYFPTRNVNGYDFHPVALFLPLFLFAAWALERGRVVGFLVLLGIAALCQENGGLVVGFWGLSLLLFRPRRPALGLGLAVAGIAALLFALTVGIPRFAGAPFWGLDRYSHLGSNTGEVLGSLVRHPWQILVSLVWPPPKIEYVVRVFGPFAFLPFLRGGWRYLIVAAPTYLQNTLSHYPQMYGVNFQYTAPMTPFLFLATLDVVRRALDRGFPCLSVAHGRRSRVAALLLVGFAIVLSGRSELGKLRELPSGSRAAWLDRQLVRIPPAAAVSAQASLVSHLAHRRRIYIFPDRVDDVEYVVVDRKGFDPSWHVGAAQFEAAAGSLKAKGYRAVFDEDGLSIHCRSNTDAPP